MLPLTTVVAIAVSCSVLFIVCSVIGTIVWIRIRQERLSMAVANARTGRYARGLQNFPADTVTELSPEEGAALGQYGHLPYGNPTEWALIESRERLIKPPLLDDPPNFSEKARSFRNSLTRSKSRRASRGGLRRPPRLSSLGETTRESTPVDEKPSAEEQQQQHQQNNNYPPDIKDDVSLSAVEGVMELPTERSPRQTPDKEPPSRLSVVSGIQDLTGPWSVLINREYSSGLFPLHEDGPENFDPYQYRVIRGGSIATQSPGTAPDLPVPPPPPPCAYPPNRFRMSRNESSTCFSSLSLDTADSSILDDGRRTPMLMDSNFNSPSLPPCPTFAPYSANDVGRSLSMTSKGPMPGPTYAFHSHSLEMEAARLERERGSPRRSLTARNTSHSSERHSPPPRRSESVLASGPKRDSRFASLGQTPVLNPSPNNIPAHWNGVNYNTALLPHFSQMQRQHRRQESNDSLFSRADSVVSVPDANAGRKQGNFMAREPAQLPDGVPSRPPQSVLKGSHGPRKGHKRQNCVRISIHPPITFGGPVFSPMAEEPEEHEQGPGGNPRPGVAANNMTSISNVSTLAVDRYSGQDMSRPPSYRRASNTSPGRKRKQHVRAGSGDAGKQKVLPGLVTSMPIRKVSLSRTPSPDRSPAVWTATHPAPSPTMHENAPVQGGGQRISAVRGPRSQPRKAGPNNNKGNPIQRVLTENAASPPSSTVPSRKSSNNSKDAEKSQPALHRGESNATDKSTRIDREAMEGLEVVSGPQTSQETLAPEGPSVKKTPSTRSENIVTIWEDHNLERSPVKQTSTEVVELQGDVAFDDVLAKNGNVIDKDNSNDSDNDNDNDNDENNNNNNNNEDNTDNKPQTSAVIERHRSTGGLEREPSMNNLEEIKQPVRAASQRTGKPELMTPAKKALGLGIETGTPRSLYDGSGFLKE